MESAAPQVPRSCTEARAMLLRVFSCDEVDTPVKGTSQLNALATRLGAKRIVTRPLDVSGMLIPSEEGYVIAIRENDSNQKQRYSLAHEIGHLVIANNAMHEANSLTKHRTQPAPHGHRDEREERLCEAMAAELLMPVEAFRKGVSELGPTLTSVSQLSVTFGASITATTIRYCELSLEPCLLVKWRTDQRYSGTPVLDWQKRNEISGPSAKVAPNRGSTQSAVLVGGDAAYTSDGLKTTYEVLLTRVFTGQRSHMTFPRYMVESMGFSQSNNRFAFSVAYLDRQFAK